MTKDPTSSKSCTGQCSHKATRHQTSWAADKCVAITYLRLKLRPQIRISCRRQCCVRYLQNLRDDTACEAHAARDTNRSTLTATQRRRIAAASSKFRDFTSSWATSIQYLSLKRRSLVTGMQKFSTHIADTSKSQAPEEWPEASSILRTRKYRAPP